MIAGEMKNGVSIVRIHDEYYAKEPLGCMKQMNRIITNSYKRRAAMRLTAVHCQPGSIDSGS